MDGLIPLFPLHTVLFPGGPLPLRVFETRYIDMVTRCLKQGSGFGVVLIRDGNEVGAVAETYDTGTYGGITYWEQRKDGLLGITVRGERRFRILETEVQSDQLLLGTVEWLPEPEPTGVPEQFQPLVELLESILDSLDHPYVTLPRHLEDAAWVSGRLAELLPLSRSRKQKLLHTDDPIKRLRDISAAITAGDL